MAPLQVVPLEKTAYVTLRRYCPSAAANEGRSIQEQLDSFRDLLKRSGEEVRPAAPPPLRGRYRRPWKDLAALNESFGRLMTDGRYPLVRRVVHGLQFCRLLDHCRLGQFQGDRLTELFAMLEAAAVEDAGLLFKERLPPSRQAGKLFRQSLLEYVRLHPDFVGESSWKERGRLIAASIRFGRGKGPVPLFRLPFPPATFESQERALGPMGETALKPLRDYFETAVVSWRYALLKRPGWSMVESFRALALCYPLGMWVLRLACGEREPTVNDVVRVVMMLDRGQTFAPLVGFRHRLRVRALAHKDQLDRLAVWYAR
jgi:hypothetical protein